MNINDEFASKYLKAADLQGRSTRVKISNITREELEEKGKTKTKIVIFFAGKQKGLICNRTNAMTIAEVWGPETDNWIGGDLELFSTKVPFQGTLTDSLRVRPLPKQRQAAPATAPAGDWQAPAPTTRDQPAPAYDDGFDDAIPF